MQSCQRSRAATATSGDGGGRRVGGAGSGVWWGWFSGEPNAECDFHGEGGKSKKRQ